VYAGLLFLFSAVQFHFESASVVGLSFLGAQFYDSLDGADLAVFVLQDCHGQLFVGLVSADLFFCPLLKVGGVDACVA
jgi:hypothetical protein